jgi:hypothetical protein
MNVLGDSSRLTPDSLRSPGATEASQKAFGALPLVAWRGVSTMVRASNTNHLVEQSAAQYDGISTAKSRSCAIVR